MEIKKADSKGRVTGFEPGELYAFDRVKGYFSKVVVRTPDGRDISEAIRGELKETEQVLTQIAALSAVSREAIRKALDATLVIN